MGLFQRIKAWLKREGSSKVIRRVSEDHIQTQSPRTEIDLLIHEHERLETERLQLRQEIEFVESQYARGEIAAADRDRAYRMRLARAGRISLRQMEIRRQLLQNGYPLPKTWGSIQGGY